MRVLPVLLLLAPLLAPLVAAAPASITVPASHVGDAALYNVTDHDKAFSVLTRVEGASGALDARGEPAQVVRITQQTSGEPGVCSVRLGGADTVRRDEGPGYRYHFSDVTANATTMFSGEACEGRNPLGGRTLREGDTLLLRDLRANLNLTDVRSAPAVATTFHDRAALRFDFDLGPAGSIGFDPGQLGKRQPTPTYSATLADGLPGIVLETFGAYAHRLDGFSRGAGAAIPTQGPAAVSVACPTFPTRGARLDDAAFGLAFPFADAIAAARANPQMDLRAWLDEHPDARVLRATYAYPTDPGAGGSWRIYLVDGESSRVFDATRPAVYSPATGPLAGLHPMDQTKDPGLHDGHGGAAPLPADVASSTCLRATLERQGFPLDHAKSLAWLAAEQLPNMVVDPPAFQVSTLGSAHDGVMADLDLRDGAQRYLYAQTRGAHTGPLPWVHAGEGLDASAFGVRFGEGLSPVATATVGVALVALVAKLLLLPLYTRLRRATLLEHPVRAALVEAARARPGISLAELTDVAGVGSGATRVHLRRLRAHGFLHEVREGRHVSYFVAGAMPPELARRQALRLSETARRAYDLFRAEPALSLREAGRRLGVSAPAVHRAKKRLEKAGLLRAAQA